MNANEGTGPAGQAHAGALRGRLSLAATLQWAAPLARRFGIAFGNWLVSVGWWKFFFLSLLLVIFSSIAFHFVESRSDAGDSGYVPGTISVDVHVTPKPDGSVQIESGGAAGASGKGRAHSRKKPPAADAASGDDDGVLLQIDGDGGSANPSVRVDRQGVRILADDAGGKATVVIDQNGVRIEKIGADAAPGAPGSAATPAANTAPAPLADPRKVAQAVEAARGKIQSILQEQVDKKLHDRRMRELEERDNWLEMFAFLFIIAMIMLKVVLGSKSKAEFQARQASATAAEEGLKRQLAEAQVKMMQAQVEPHFLFNTLASVDYLIETDPVRASRMQKNLIQYLRSALPQMRQGSSNLGRELLLCRSYLEILKVRMDERLQFSVNVPDGLRSATFPPMMLQTLVENAIKHGLEPKPSGGTLAISAQVSDGSLRVAVADSGMGFGVAERAGTGLGLANVRERLQALYGPAAQLSIDANADGGTIATIIVPYRIEAQAAGADAGTAAAPAPAV